MYAIPYISYYVIILFCGIRFKEYIDIKKFQQVLIVFSSLFFLGLRGFIYTDFSNYYQFFSDVPKIQYGFSTLRTFFMKNTYGMHWERGFCIYAILLKSICPNYFFFQFSSYSIDFFILYFFFKRYIPRYYLLALSFFFIFQGNIIEINLLRNSKAMMLFFISLKYLYKKKFINYLLLNILGTFFHSSAILYIPLYFILDRNFKKTSILLLFVLGNAIFLLQIEWLKKTLESVLSIIKVNNSFIKLVKAYLKNSTHSAAYGITIGYIERFLSFILIYKFQDKLLLKQENRIFINTFYLYILITLYCSEFSIMLERVAALYIFSYWVLFPNIYNYLNKRQKKVFLVIFLFYSCLKLIKGHGTLKSSYENAIFSDNDFNRRVNYLK